MDRASPETDRRYTREEYRAWYEAQPRGRYERVDGEIVAMAPERVVHARIKGSVYTALKQALKVASLPCEAFPDGVTVETDDSDYEPDALVNCGPPTADEAIAAPNPVIVVEVLSPGTAATDTGTKLLGYFKVPSITHYLIVHPTRRAVIHHRRNGTDIETRIVASGPIMMDPPGITITVEDIYES